MLIVVLGVLLTLQPTVTKIATGTLMCGDKPYPNAKVQLEGTDSKVRVIEDPLLRLEGSVCEGFPLGDA
ncbi:unnamed protein product [Nippostrongylus brasiliensis]|uniref:Transthyretin-like family protein n=1 Tax=Nippostrongylus brasiliensis TaxID=27835 RepID=A0A0N4Y9Q2_NIPBR|nr:unnamed protein product [Nippostrongylus brasiliensis]